MVPTSFMASFMHLAREDLLQIVEAERQNVKMAELFKG
jgi:hypothetical protein